MDPKFTIFPYSNEEFERSEQARAIGSFSAGSTKSGILSGRPGVSEFVRLSDFDPSIARIEAMPIRMRIASGRSAFDFIPDYKVHTADGGAYLLHFVSDDWPHEMRRATIAATGNAKLEALFVDIRFLSTEFVRNASYIEHMANGWSYPQEFMQDVAVHLVDRKRSNLQELSRDLVAKGWPDRNPFQAESIASWKRQGGGPEPDDFVIGTLFAALARGDLDLELSVEFNVFAPVWKGPADASKRNTVHQAQPFVVATTIEDPEPPMPGHPR